MTAFFRPLAMNLARASIALMFVGNAHSADLFNNLAGAGTTGYIISPPQTAAMRVVNSTGAAFTAAKIKVLVESSFSLPSMAICPDNAGLPASVGCTVYSTSEAVNGKQVYTYTGNYLIPDGATVWVRATSDNVWMKSWIHQATGTVNLARSSDGGLTWTAAVDQPLTFALTDSELTPVPVLDSILLLAFMATAMLFAAARRTMHKTPFRIKR